MNDVLDRAAPARALADPVWIAKAKEYLGQREIKGPHHNPHVLKWWKNIGAPFTDDETPWCGAFVGGVLSEVGIKPQKGGASALAWKAFGKKLTKPAVGCIAIKERKGGGHVTFVIGKDKAGRLLCIGGNQNDAVTIAAYPPSVFVAYRWPGIAPYQERYNLPVLDTKGHASVTEA